MLRYIVDKSRGKISYFFGPQPIESYRLNQGVPTVYECTLCGACTEQCKFEVKPHTLWYKFRALMNMAGYIPEPLKHVKGGFTETKNPYSLPEDMRSYWVKKEKLIGKASVKRNARVIYFVGCTTAFKRVNRGIAGSMARILNYVGEDWSLLGEKEWCCGAPWLMIGDIERAREHAVHNVEAIEETGAEEVVVTCATCYRAIKQEYGELIDGKLGFKVLHAVELIKRYIDEGKINLAPTDIKLTYHDPCELSRLSGVIDEPRQILRMVSGEYREMEKNKENGFCCGGGGFLQATNNDVRLKVAQVRVNQAVKEGAQYLVSACPSCKMALVDGAKELKSEVKVVDIVELVAQLLGLSSK